MTNKTEVPLDLLKNIEMTWRQASGFSNKANDIIAEGLHQLRAILAAPAVEVPAPVVPLANPKTRYVRVPSREDPKYHEEWPEIEGGLVFDGVTYCNHLFEALKRERITLVETLPVEAIDE